MNSLRNSRRTTDIAEKLDEIVSSGSQSIEDNADIPCQNAEIVVFWASQFGAAELLAVWLDKEIRQRLGKKVFAADASDHERASIQALFFQIRDLHWLNLWGM